MLSVVDWGVLLGSLGTFIAALVGGIALVQSRRTESKTATRDEIQQAFDMQDKAMLELETSNTRLATEIARVRGKNDAMHETLNTTFAKMAELKAEHSKCTRDLNSLGTELRSTNAELKGVRTALRIAEAKIAELGG